MKEKELEKFFKMFPNSKLIHFLWNIAEDGRIEYRLKKKYRGLKYKIEEIDAKYFETIQPFPKMSKLEKAVELILHLNYFGKTKEPIPKDLEDVVLEIHKKFESLKNDHSTVNDSIKAATEAYFILKEKLGDKIKKFPNPITSPVNLKIVKARKDEEFEILKQFYGDLPDEELEKLMELLGEKGFENLKAAAEGKEKKENSGGEKGVMSQLRKFKYINKKPFFYDEWDYTIDDYKIKWCKVYEVEPLIRQKDQKIIDETLKKNRKYLHQLKKQFQMIKLEKLKKVKKEPDGEEIDIDAAVENYVDYRAGLYPSDRVYIKILKKEREISTLFLIDLSGSTTKISIPGKSVLEGEKEAILLLAETMEEIGDDFGIFGYDSTGKDVFYYVIKDFDERYKTKVKEKIANLTSGGSTRSAPAVRHSIKKLNERGLKTKLLFHITDAELNYGGSTISHKYMIEDMKKCYSEAKKNRIFPLQIVVGKKNVIKNSVIDAYISELKKMDVPNILINKIEELPEKIAKLYRKLTFQ